MPNNNKNKYPRTANKQNNKRLEKGDQHKTGKTIIRN